MPESRIGPVRAALNGGRRLLAVRRIVIWVWLANLAFALPLAANGNEPTLTPRPPSLASASVLPTQAISGAV